jgi:hypothetical protein
MEDGGWRMEDGRRKMEDGRWRIEDGYWMIRWWIADHENRLIQLNPEGVILY